MESKFTWPKICTCCGTFYTQDTWSKLPYVGIMLDLELRNCTTIKPNGTMCASTLAVDLAMTKFLITRERCHNVFTWYSNAKIAELIPVEGLLPKSVLALKLPRREKHWILTYAANATNRILREHTVWCIRKWLESNTQQNLRIKNAVHALAAFAQEKITVEELHKACDNTLAIIMRAAFCDVSTIPTIALRTAAFTAHWLAYRACVKAEYSRGIYDVTYADIQQNQLEDLAQRLTTET